MLQCFVSEYNFFMELPFVLYMHLHQGARGMPNGKQPSVQASLKSCATEGKKLEGKFGLKILVDLFTTVVRTVNSHLGSYMNGSIRYILQ